MFQLVLTFCMMTNGSLECGSLHWPDVMPQAVCQRRLPRQMFWAQRRAERLGIGVDVACMPGIKV